MILCVAIASIIILTLLSTIRLLTILLTASLGRHTGAGTPVCLPAAVIVIGGDSSRDAATVAANAAAVNRVSVWGSCSSR